MRIQASNVNYLPKIQVQTKPMGVTCPHGSPAGACPACLGGGGGGGSSVKLKPTAKELGLLTWADLMPVWLAMQAAKQRQEYDKKLDTLLSMKKYAEQSNIYKTISNFIDNKIMPLLKFLDSKVLTPLTKTINQTMLTLNNFFVELKTQLMQQITKLAGVLNEKLHQIMDKLKNVAETFKNAMEVFISNFKDKEKAIKEFLAAFSNKLKKKLFRIVEATDNSFAKRGWKPKTAMRRRRRCRAATHSFEELENHENNAEIYEELINV